MSRKPDSSSRNFSPFKSKAGLAAVFMTTVLAAGCTQEREQQMQYSDFVNNVESDKINSITVQRDPASGDYIATGRMDGERTPFKTFIPAGLDSEIGKTLKDNDVNVDVEPPPGEGISFGTIVSLAFLGIMIFFIFNMMRAMKGGGRGGPGGVAKSKAKLLKQDHGKTTFEDVAGVDSAKEDLQEVVEFLKNPARLQRLGGKVPTGTLLEGPPGTGKTLLAKAVAGEAGVPFFSVSGSDFVEMYVGVGAARVRDMFAQAKKQAPCILFIDEIDAVGKARGSGMNGSHDEREQTLNQILVEMDGLESGEDIVVIGATNRSDVLDKALLRPGRFDRKVVVGVPDLMGRKAILEVHMRKSPMGPDVSALQVARGTTGFSGADLANLVNEAAVLAAKKDRNAVGMADFEDARDKIIMGAPRDSLIMSEKEKKNTAYHEAGHALVGLHFKGHLDPIYKATIVPRGQALGMVSFIPDADRISMSRKQLEAHMAMAYGGRWAEELMFGRDEVTTGASNDIQQATNIAHKMVKEWGYSDKAGLLRYVNDQQNSYLGLGGSGTREMSEKTARMIDEEVKALADAASTTARKILENNKEQHEALTQALLKYETLSGKEIEDLVFHGTPIVREGFEDDVSEKAPSSGNGKGPSRPNSPPMSRIL